MAPSSPGWDKSLPTAGYAHDQPGGGRSWLSENLFPQSPEKQEKLTKAGVGNEHKGFFPAPGYAGSTGGWEVL